MKSKEIYMKFPTERELKVRMYAVCAYMAVASVVGVTGTEYLIHHYELGYERIGFLTGESLVAGWLLSGVVPAFALFLIRIAYYISGYTVPEKDNKHIKEHLPNTYSYFLVRKGNDDLAAAFAFGTAIVFVALFIVQAILSLLWGWTPYSVLFPLVFGAVPFLVVQLHKRNRRKLLEREEIIERLSGDR